MVRSPVFAAFCVLSTLLIAVGAAGAQTAGAEDAAKAAFFEGRDALDKGQYAAAVGAFDRAILQLGGPRRRVLAPLIRALVEVRDPVRAKREIARYYELFGRDGADGAEVRALEARVNQERSRDDQAFADATARNTIEGYQRYLSDFPTGVQLEKARERIAALTAQHAAASAQQDEQRFHQAVQSNTVYAYQDYLRQHPRGRYVGNARAAIAEAARAEELQRTSAAEQARRTRCSAELVGLRRTRNVWWFRLGIGLGIGLGLIAGGVAIIATRPTAGANRSSKKDTYIGLGVMAGGALALGIAVPKKAFPPRSGAPSCRPGEQADAASPAHRLDALLLATAAAEAAVR